MGFVSKRPAAGERCFVSPVIDAVIGETCAKIADPELAWLFANCFPNTLDTTVTFMPDDGTGRPDTFVITGDIDAMWLRDSTNQVWPYMQFADRCAKLRAMLRGLIHRQAKCVLLDPYANAFYRTPEKVSQWKSDHTAMKPGVHERKYELDSLASVLRLATGYFLHTGDRMPFDGEFLAAVRVILQTVKAEQAGTPEQTEPAYAFARTTPHGTDTLSGGGHGNPCRRTGMSRSPFRPSDDAAVFQYHVAGNAMMSVMLVRMEGMLRLLGEGELGDACERLHKEIHAGLRKHAVIKGPQGHEMYAYEVDGFGSCALMDDANVPNLLSLPYLEFCETDSELYQHTRRFILSTANPFFHKGNAVPRGAVGGPHVGQGWVWPLSIITQAITSTDEAEIVECVRVLKGSHAGTGFMHEAFWKDNTEKFTRDWFAWANTFFGELILELVQKRPALLARAIV